MLDYYGNTHPGGTLYFEMPLTVRSKLLGPTTQMVDSPFCALEKLSLVELI